MSKLPSRIKLKAREYKNTYIKTIIFISVIIIAFSLAVHYENQRILALITFIWIPYYLHKKVGFPRDTPESILDTQNKKFTLEFPNSTKVIHVNEIKKIYISFNWVVLKTKNDDFYLNVSLEEKNLITLENIVNYVRLDSSYTGKNKKPIKRQENRVNDYWEDLDYWDSYNWGDDDGGWDD